MVQLLYHDGTESVPSWYFFLATSFTLPNFTTYKPRKEIYESMSQKNRNHETHNATTLLTYKQ